MGVVDVQPTTGVSDNEIAGMNDSIGVADVVPRVKVNSDPHGLVFVPSGSETVVKC
jgi:hypothetical protein